jgi:aldose 1-epimerase
MTTQWGGKAPDGSDIITATIGSQKLQATIISFGACLQDLRLQHFDFPLVLGYADITDYISNTSYFGAVVGRNANRIAQGRCLLNGQILHLTKSVNDHHQLHGGPNGSTFRNWQLVSKKTNQVVLQDILPHGHMGFPGNLCVQITYTITQQTLDVKIEACADQTTLCNFMLHNYFNLDDSLNLDHHFLSVAATTYLPTNQSGIPIGNEASIVNTDYDYRTMKSLNKFMTERSLDHNFCIRNNPGVLQKVAQLNSCSSGLSMQLSSTEVGLQVYNAAHVSVEANKSLHGRTYYPYSGLALEPQGWPNAVNEGKFPSTILHPSETYLQHTSYQFDINTG